MAKRLRILVLLVSLIVISVAESDTCQRSTCTCDFENADDVSTTKSEILAGSIGALGPLLLSGVGFGIYKFVSDKASLENPLPDEPVRKPPMKPRSAVTPDNGYRRGSLDSKGPLLDRRGSTSLSVIDQESEYDDTISLRSTASTSLSGIINPDDQHPTLVTPSNISTRFTRPPPTTKPSSLYSAGSDGLNSWMH